MLYIDPSGHASCAGKNWDDGPQCVTKAPAYYDPVKHPENFSGNTAAAVQGLKQTGLINAAPHDILAFALQQEFWSQSNTAQLDTPSDPLTSSMITAITRRYYDRCKAGILSGSCLGWFLGYFQGVSLGQGSAWGTNAQNLAAAILSPGDSVFNGLSIPSIWKEEGCATGGLCHWANAKPALATKLTGISVPDPNMNYSLVSIDTEKSIEATAYYGRATLYYSHATYLFSTGKGEYYVVLNEADWNGFCKTDGLCWP